MFKTIRHCILIKLKRCLLDSSNLIMTRIYTQKKAYQNICHNRKIISLFRVTKLQFLYLIILFSDQRTNLKLYFMFSTVFTKLKHWKLFCTCALFILVIRTNKVIVQSVFLLTISNGLTGNDLWHPSCYLPHFVHLSSFSWVETMFTF